MFAETYARLLLVAHTILAAALVAASTHLVVWMRGFPRGRFQRLRGVRIFALVSAALYLVTLLVGNAIYPVYKVRVRAEYLDHPGVVMRDVQARLATREQVAARYRGEDPGELDAAAVPDPEVTERAGDVPRQAAKVARWFDVKEHWVALGAAMSLGCAVLMLAWSPLRHGQAISSIAFLMALAAALATWLGAIIGIVVSSYRAIGGP